MISLTLLVPYLLRKYIQIRSIGGENWNSEEKEKGEGIEGIVPSPICLKLMDIQFLFAQIVNGFVLGSIYVLLSLGLTIILGMLGVANFAHGAFYMLGAYGVYTIVKVYNGHFWIALIVAPIIVSFIAMVIEFSLLKRLYNLPPFYTLLLTFGLMIVLQELIQIIYTPIGKPFHAPRNLSGENCSGRCHGHGDLRHARDTF